MAASADYVEICRELSRHRHYGVQADCECVNSCAL